MTASIGDQRGPSMKIPNQLIAKMQNIIKGLLKTYIGLLFSIQLLGRVIGLKAPLI